MIVVSSTRKAINCYEAFTRLGFNRRTTRAQLATCQRYGFHVSLAEYGDESADVVTAGNADRAAVVRVSSAVYDSADQDVLMKVVVTSNTTKIAARYRRMARNMPGIVQQAVHDLVQREAVPLFQNTTRTWTNQPTFETTQTAMGWAVKVTPEYPYAWVNAGTRPHVIEAKHAMLLRFSGPYHAKTKVNVIGSFKGGRGNKWTSKKRVNHPGVEARNFSDIIMKRIQTRAAGAVRDALNQASYGVGQGI